MTVTLGVMISTRFTACQHSPSCQGSQLKAIQTGLRVLYSMRQKKNPNNNAHLLLFSISRSTSALPLGFSTEDSFILDIDK